MKIKACFLLAVVLTVSLTASAQHYRNSRYYNPGTDRLDYTQPHQSDNRFCSGQRHYISPYSYVGLRVGASFSNLISDDNSFCTSKTKTGLNLGVAAGFAVSHHLPLYFESGLYYTEKGGKCSDMRYNLSYLEIPLTLKYSISPSRNFAVQPYLGGYLACGVAGKVKYNDYSNGCNSVSYNAFGNKADFQHFDGGLKVGCGISYDVLYADITYEHGLTNITNDTFNSTHNSAFMLNVGLNF